MWIGLLTLLTFISLDATPEHELLWTIVEDLPAVEEDGDPLVYELELLTGFHSTANAPETSLYIDEVTGSNG